MEKYFTVSALSKESWAGARTGRGRGGYQALGALVVLCQVHDPPEVQVCLLFQVPVHLNLVLHSVMAMVAVR